MIGATHDEIKNALARMELESDGNRLRFREASATRIRVAFCMQEPHQIVYLARLLCHLSYDQVHFNGAYLWVTAWGLWNPHVEAVALKNFEQFRRSYGESRSMESAPGTHFRSDEFVESVCCLLQPMLAGWDAYCVPTWTWGSLDYFVFVSHDGFADIEVRTLDMRRRAEEVLSKCKWLPLMK